MVKSQLTASDTCTQRVPVTAEQLTKRVWKLYYAVHFIVKPFEDIDEYVSVPSAWIFSCYTNHDQGVVAYPNREAAKVTKNRVIRSQKPKIDWGLYSAILKFGSNTYKEVEDWIMKRQTSPNMQAELRRRKRLQSSSIEYYKNLPRLLPKPLIPRLPEAETSNGNQLKSNKLKPEYNAQPGCSRWDDDKYWPPKAIAKSSHDPTFFCQPKVNQQQFSSSEEEQELNLLFENAGEVKPIPNNKDQSELTIKQQPSSSQIACQSELRKSILEQNCKNRDDNYTNNEIPNAHILPVQPISTYNPMNIPMNVSQPIVRIEKQVKNPVHQMTIAGNMPTVPQNVSNLNTATLKLLSLAAEGQLSIVTSNQSRVVSRDPKIHPKSSEELRIDRNPTKVVSVYDQPNSRQHQPYFTQRLVLDSGRQMLLPGHNNLLLNEQFQRTFNQSVPNLENSLNINSGAPYFGEASGPNAVIEHEVNIGPEIAVNETSGETMTTSYGTSISTSSISAESTKSNTISDEPRRNSEEQQMLDQFGNVFSILYTTLKDASKMHQQLGRSIGQAADVIQKFINSVQKCKGQHNADEFDMTPDEHATDDLLAEQEPSQEVPNNEDQHTNNPNKVLSKKPNVSLALPPEYDPNDTKWTLRHRVMRQGLVELMPQTGILVNSNELSYRVNESKDCKSLAQLLLPVVFNRNALGVCSTFIEKTQGVNVGFTRPELDEYATTVLLSYVVDHGQRFGWNDELEPILHAVHNTLQEFREE